MTNVRQPSKEGSDSPHTISIPKSLRLSARQVVKARYAFADTVLRQHDKIFLDFFENGNLPTAEQALARIGARTSSFFNNVLLKFKSRFDSLRRWHDQIQAALAKTVDKTQIAETTKGHERDVETEQTLKQIEKLIRGFCTKFGQLKDAQSFEDKIQLWSELNLILAQIRKINSGFVKLSAKLKAVLSKPIPPTSLYPVDLGERHDASLTVSTTILLAEPIVTLCMAIGNCDPKTNLYMASLEEMGFSNDYHLILNECHFAKCTVPRDEEIPTTFIFQKKLETFTVKLKRFLKLFKISSNRTRSAVSQESFLIVIKSGSHILVNGKSIMKPHARYALVAMASLAKVKTIPTPRCRAWCC